MPDRKRNLIVGALILGERADEVSERADDTGRHHFGIPGAIFSV